MARISKPFVIFASIGVLNTAIDAGIFAALHAAGLGIIIANTVSTSVAIVVSYILNSRYTFSHSGKVTGSKFGKFIAINLTGLWLLQPLIIYGVLHIFWQFGIEQTNLTAVIGKMVAIPATLVWNYTLYRKIVFVK